MHIIVLVSGIWLGSCEVINPAETIPTIIHLEPFNFQVQPGQGSANNKITEVWVSANNNFLGAFLPPVDINYLEEGDTQFTFRPGIRNNGILEDAIIYPIYVEYNLNIKAEPGSHFDVTPVTSYQPEASFSLLADFELDNPFVDNRDTVSASNLIRSMADVFEGQYAGQMILSEEAYFIEVGHSLPMGDLPTDGTPTYLEFRYKSEVDMSIGLLGINLQGQSFSNFFYLVNAKEDWNMLYIELTDLLATSDFPAYKILFRSLYPSNATQPEYTIFLDNIKVVHL